MHGNDTLALGNLTWVMIFQSSIPVAFGLLFTPWNPAALDLFAAMLLASGGPMYLVLRRSEKLQTIHPTNGGAFYLAFVLGAVLAAPLWEKR